ncbi:TPA: hypothetical protein ACPY5B_004576 [Yersinia enterocolitica]|uniref:hypothetical protein n=1 Tax=Yersinia TaxID=629 RepID=UPI0005E84CB6|nr:MULTISPECIES: hypothetical protein [Yersinia]EKN3339944.1 hypothetical protein [Yersinia enterocolitica]ELW8173911.1 hypothetical protein [Yersinia enterocolitica]MDN0129638.1 hypothetical protein [Yersinia massiliensis]QKJ09758.1 hypothetical protein HRD68_02770 [Yersinia massiliensis]CQH54874.1 Uncharacterised protein [Yersinia frederiksenii]
MHHISDDLSVVSRIIHQISALEYVSSLDINEFKEIITELRNEKLLEASEIICNAIRLSKDDVISTQPRT